MSTSTAFKTALGNLYFNNVDHAEIGDAAGLQNSATEGSYYLALHTGDPGITGSQTTSEATFGAYVRIAVPRNNTNLTISVANISNALAIAFAEASSGSETITHFSLGSDLSGAGNLQFFGPLDTSRPVSTGVTLEFPANELDVDIT